MEHIQYQMKSKVGPLYLVASKQGMQGVYFDKQAVKTVKNLNRAKPQEQILDQAQKQLNQYFSGKRKIFDLDIKLSGTAFQRKVWSELAKIPYGQTVSYRQIAQRIKSPKAFRAVGSANGKNPLCVVIPCHRVIAADGSLGGYSAGLDMKKKLLRLEGISVKVRDY